MPAMISNLKEWEDKKPQHKDSLLTHHLQEMRDYMPAPHREFLARIEQNDNLRTVALQDSELKDIYNECVNQIINFRNQHFDYAVSYIAKKVENPEGTGGTPYIPWLKQLREETEDHLIK